VCDEPSGRQDDMVTVPGSMPAVQDTDNESTQNVGRFISYSIFNFYDRIIGLAESHKILQQPVNVTESVLASEIIFVCCMICSFHNC